MTGIIEACDSVQLLDNSKPVLYNRGEMSIPNTIK